MGRAEKKPTLFNLRPLAERLPPALGAMIRPPLEHLLRFPYLNSVYERAHNELVDQRSDQPPRVFVDTVLRQLHVDVRVDADAIDRIPKTGPLMVVANHPYGGIEGLALPSILFRARPDVKLMVNEMLARIPELQPLFFFVDVFGSKQAAIKNAGAIKQIIKWLRDGGCLGVFPAGAVSHLRVSEGRVADPPWIPHIAAFVRRTRATVVPIYFSGRNSGLFQLAGLVHPRLRTALLPREFAKRRHWVCHAEIGKAIAPEEWSSYDSDEALIDYLRTRCYALSSRIPPRQKVTRKLAKPLLKLARLGRRDEPVAEPPAPDAVRSELARLPEENLLATTGDFSVFVASWPQLDATRNELGRLRELTFRAVGEGTGKPVDLDEFDKHYLHLLVWDRQQSQLVGSYRMGLFDPGEPGVSAESMYLATLFEFGSGFLEKLGPAIELGRSFVRSEYQRNFSPLMLLWKGIGQFVARHPRYRTLIGPVSISARYTLASRVTIAEALSGPTFRSPLADLVRPRRPLMARPGKLGREVRSLGRLVRSIDELVDVVSDMEPDGKSLPILLKQYLKLGARTLGFNVDPAFGNCLDCLCVLDLVTADARQVQRYMGKEQAMQFYAAHGITHGTGS